MGNTADALQKMQQRQAARMNMSAGSGFNFSNGVATTVAEGIVRAENRKKEEHASRLKADKDKFVRLIKGIYVLLTTNGVYSGSLRDVWLDMKKFGVDQKKMGKLGTAVDRMLAIDNLYSKIHEDLTSVWGTVADKNEIDDFIMNTYSSVSDIIENAFRLTPEGGYKKDYKRVMLVPEELLPEIDKFIAQNHPDVKLDVI